MSQAISGRIDQYRAGTLSRADLVNQLAAHKYVTPERDLNKPSDPYAQMAHTDMSPDYTDGSWDEVKGAMATGQLPQDVYMEIVNRVWDTRGHTHPSRQAPTAD